MRALLGVSWILAGCGDETLLIVEVRTDYQPVVEFDSVEVAVADRVVTEPAAPSEPYRDGVRIAEVEGLIEGPSIVSARLLLGRATVAARNQTVTVSGRTAITIDLTRGCLDCVDGGFADGGSDSGLADSGFADSGLADSGSACPDCPTDCCEGGCTDLQTDPNHCGECGRACSAGQACCGGSCDLPSSPRCFGCMPECRAGLACCSAACIDATSDEANCGMCGNRCAPAEQCMGGACLTSCGGEWVDVDTSRDHCGACDRRCRPAPGGRCDCAGGGCVGLCL